MLHPGLFACVTAGFILKYSTAVFTKAAPRHLSHLQRAPTDTGGCWSPEPRGRHTLVSGARCSHPILLSTASLPSQKPPNPFCTGKQRLTAARALKPQEASNKRLFKLDVDGKAQVLYLFPNHCYFAELRGCSCPTSPLAGLYSQKPFAQLQHGSTKPRSHSGALVPEGFGTAACRAGRQQSQSPSVVPPGQ